MTEKTEQPETINQPDDERDTEGHSLLMYEQARLVVRERERDVQKHAQEARMLEARKRQKR